MARPAKQTLKRYVEPLKADPNPVYACQVVRTTDGEGQVLHWMAFDPRYGPSSESQIDWHVKHGTPGAELWEVGQPSAPYA